MDNFLPEIRNLADRIGKTEEKRKRIAGFLRAANPEMNAFKKLEPDALDNIRIAGIDGGISKKSLHGLDFMLIRAAGSLFHYRKGKFHAIEYFPSRTPSPKPFVMEALSDIDWAHSASVERQDMEITTAMRCMEKLKPDVLLLDGSIVPHYSDKPPKNSAIYGRYSEMVEHYRVLYSRATETNTIVAGVVEDSRGMMFCDLMRNELAGRIEPELSGVLEKTRDTNLLHWTLEKGERSRAFMYSQTPSEHPFLKDVPEFANKITCFYLKTAMHDRPIRVDVLDERYADKLASILLAISGQHSGYGLPVPLIEADNVAKLSENDVEFLYSQIMGQIGNLPGIMKLRREQRPF